MPSNSGPQPAAAGRSSTPGTRVIGVLGGIASGKSAVARLLAGRAGVVIDADQIARDVLGSEAVRHDLRRAFGDGVFRPDGSPDREALAQRVFTSAADKARLESFTHPAIRARIHAALDEARGRKVPRVVLDVPLLLENDSQHGLVEQCDVLVFVDAPTGLREERAQAARAWPPGEVARREAQQLGLSEKRARADHVILNQTNLADLEQAVAQVLAAVEKH
jgi:dephospho-CoA kinase